ncbi:EamA family transporter [Kineosporia succinea]|uniref:Inner membrane transporter RhtA n=1 Tax=Kineosporia succinea TaxID=84632 RepID=A0ABT9P6D7_9ACTN|nr:EamA family transporter [Kineosporia succinea]MDP9827630.1 inner membrane transporter RhtA [Kineosporia succinea]
MTTTAVDAPGRPAPAFTGTGGKPVSIATMLFSGTSTQIGAAVGAHAFSAIGPPGVVAVRQLVAACVLLPVARPPMHRFTWRQWWPTLLLGLVFSLMNLGLYTAIDRVGLGLAVTLEFLGPLGVALARSRTRLDAACAVFAGAGVVVLVAPGPSSDWLGIAAGLLGAACWAAYILLNAEVGARLPGLQATAAASTIATLLCLPVMIMLALNGKFTAPAVLAAIGAGVGSSVVPYACDLMVLRRVPAQFFGVFMSVNPVLASLVGIVLLGELLSAREWLGVVMVIAANVVTTTAPGRREKLPRSR